MMTTARSQSDTSSAVAPFSFDEMNETDCVMVFGSIVHHTRSPVAAFTNRIRKWAREHRREWNRLGSLFRSFARAFGAHIKTR